MKLVSYNIRFGLGLDQKIDLGRIADTVNDADIIALQEVERYWKHSGMTDQPEIISSHLQQYYWLYFPAFDVDASEAQSDGSILNRRRQFGPWYFRDGRFAWRVTLCYPNWARQIVCQWIPGLSNA